MLLALIIITVYEQEVNLTGASGTQRWHPSKDIENTF